MFTGIVRAIGAIAEIDRRGEGRTVVVDGVPAGWHVQIGDSVAVDGVCLTAEAIRGERMHAFVSPETLAKTTAGGWASRRRVHLEPALRAGDPMGGHMVLGHVDAVGAVRDSIAQETGRCVWFELPHDLRMAVFPKGSIAIDGVSLTVNQIEDDTFSVQLIPHTLACTHFRALAQGQRVNMEADPVAKQVAWVMARQRPEELV